MTERKSLSLICSGQFPQLTDDVIDEIEDYLLYSVDSEISNNVFNIIQFFQINLSSFIQSTNLSYVQQHYQKRLLRAMRFFRHSSLNYSLSRQLEDIAFSYLRNNSSSHARQLSFAFLIDHFLTDPNPPPENCQQLISWSREFTNATLQNITMADKNLYLTLIYSIPNLYSLSPQSVNIPQFIDILINIAISGVQYLRQLNFSDDHLCIVVSKSLKLCSQLIIQYKQITNETPSFLLRLENFLSSDEISFSHVYQNYLMAACSIIQIDAPFSSEVLSELAKKIIPFLVKYFKYFIQTPLSQSKKISFFLKTVAVWLSKLKTKPLNILTNILPNIWILVSSFHGQILSITVIGEIIRNLISLDLLRDYPYIHHSLLENLVASLEIVRLDIDSIDFNKTNRPFETENWLECNKLIITLIYNVVQVDFMLMQKSNIYYSAMRINTLVRFVKYICYMLDLAGSVANQNETESPLSTAILHQIHLADFRDKMTYIFDIFVSTLMKLSQPLFRHIISLTMLDLLPKQQQRYFHKRVFTQFLKGPYLFDFQSIFFATIADHFDELMFPTPPSILLMIIRIVFKTAFSDDSPLQIEQSNILCLDVYRFIIQSISSRNATLLELLLTMLHSYFQCKTNKFDSLIKIISSSPFLMNNVLRILSEDPSLKDVVSFLSLFLFPMCNMQQQLAQQQLIESWVQLFLTSIESPNRISTAIPTLYNYTSRSFAQLTANLKEPVQSTFVSSLITPLSKIPKEQNLKILLGKIPEIACKLSLQTQNSKKKKINFVLVGGFQVDMEVIFEGIKRKPTPTETEMNALFESYCQFIASLPFFEAVNESLVDRITEFIQKNSPKLLDQMYTRFLPPTRYAALFLKQKYCTSIKGIEIDDPDNFLQHIATLCYSRSTALHAIEIISFYLDLVESSETLSKINSSVLQASQYDDKKTLDIILNHILNRDFTDKIDLQNEIIQHFRLASMDIMTPIRRTAIKLLSAAEEKFGLKDLMGNYRQEILKNINSIFQNQLFSRFEFIFTKPFTDVPEPISMIQRLMEFFRSRQIPVISKEVQKMNKKLKCTDLKIAPYLNAKFVIKMIAKLALVSETLNIQTWGFIIGKLKDDSVNNLRQFIPYFVKQLKKGAKQINKTVFNSLPNNISGLISILGPNLPNSPEDIKIIRFFLEYSPFKIQLDQVYQQIMMQFRYPMKQQVNVQAKQMQQQFFQQIQQEIVQFVQLITNVIMSIQHSLPELNRSYMNQKSMIQDTLKQVSKLIAEIKPIIQKSEVDLSLLFQSYLDVLLFCKINLISVDTHYHYMFNAWPNEIIKVLILRFQKMWSFDLFFVVLDILEHPKVPQFRQTLFENLSQYFKNVFAYIMENADRDIEIVLSRSLHTLCNIVNNLQFHEFDLLQIIHLTKKILNKLKKKAVHIMKKSSEQPIFTSLFVKYVQILLPLRFASEICAYPKLFNYFKSKVMVSFITRPSIQLFQHPLFNRRLIDFMILLDDQHRKELYSLIPDPSESKSILINQILCDRYRYFPQDVQIKAGFAKYEKTPSFPVLILNFSAALLASNKCVNLVDLKDTSILTSNSYTHALAIHYKLRSIDSIKTISRFFPIIKMLSNIDSFELDGIKTALAERLETTPYTNKSSLLLFRTLGQQNCVIDHTSRAITQFIIGFSTTMLKQTSKSVDPQFIFVMPHVFQKLLVLKPTCQRLFEILLSTVVMVLKKMPDKTSMAQLIPSTMDQLIPFIDLKLVDSNLILILKEILAEKPKTDEMANQTRTKFLLQLIPVISNLLFEVNGGNRQLTSTNSGSISQLTPNSSMMMPMTPPMAQMANLSINGPSFFPYILLPNVFFTKNYSKNIYAIYQKALREAFVAGGGNVSLKVIKEMYDYLRRITNSISPPNLLSAFSTIATWLSEVTSAELVENLKILLEALRPAYPEQLITDLSCLKQPINQTVSHFILNMLDKDFPELRSISSLLNSINSIKPLITPQSIDLCKDCWKIDWFLINPDSHITVFLRLISPNVLQTLIPYFNSNEIRSIISIILNSIHLSNSFTRFMKYYIIHFPKSSLSECFYTTTSFSSMIPYPTLSLQSNIEFLETINISEDALGLLKCESKSFLNSSSFLQISQFRAAKYFFLKTMDEDPSHYFYALSELRSIDINLSLHKCNHLRSKILGHRKENTFPVITLPFYPESYDSEKSQKEYGNRLTSFISRSHIPFLFRSSLEDEVYQYIKVMQQPESLKTYKLEELERISSTAWIKALDRNMMMTSNFVWRLTILNDFLSNSELAQENEIISKIHKIISINRNLIAYLLSYSGSTRDALEYYLKSPDKKCIYVSQQNYPRVCLFYENQFKIHKAKEKVFSITPPMPITSISSPLNPQFSNNNNDPSRSLDKLREKMNFLMRDFSKINLRGRKWLDALFCIFIRYYDLIDQQASFKRLLQDLNNSTIYDSQSHISMVLCMIRKNASLVNALSQEFVNLKTEIRLSFLRWLPQLICCTPELPDELIHNLIRTNACIFYITYEDFVYSIISKFNTNSMSHSNESLDFEIAVGLNTNMKKINMMTESGSVYMRSNKLNKEFQSINEYRSGMSWVEKCQKDIQKLQMTVTAHKIMYEYLARGQIPQEVLSSLGFSNEKELVLFCEKNPPVFRTEVETNNYSSFTGFKFPSAKSILSVFLEKDNDSPFYGESILRYVTIKGESKILQIVSPEIYSMNQKERLFVEFVGQLIEKNVSSHARSRSTYYPFSFLVHQHLLITDSHQFTSLHSTIQPISAIKYIVNSAMKNKRINENEDEEDDDDENEVQPTAATAAVLAPPVVDEDDEKSPKMVAFKKKSKLPNSLVSLWFLQGTEGSKIDFVFMRQSFASYYAVFSYLHFIFKSQVPPLPSIMIFKDRQKCCIPDFMNSSPPAVRFLTQTPQISGFLPPFVMKGSFATSWQIVSDSLCMFKERIRIILMALMIQLDPPSKSQIQDFVLRQQQQKQLNGEQSEQLKLTIMQQLKNLQQQNKLLMMKTSSIILSSSRIDRLASIHMTEETEKCDDVYPFMFVEHLINNSANVLEAQPIAFSWI